MRWKNSDEKSSQAKEEDDAYIDTLHRYCSAIVLMLTYM